MKASLVLLFLLSCDGSIGTIEKEAVEEFKSVPLGLPCDPDDTPDYLPGCKVCETEGFRECCKAVPEELACNCMAPTGVYKWYMGFCRN